MTWALWQAVAVQAGILGGLGLVIMLIAALRHQYAIGSARVDHWLVNLAAALIAVAAMSGCAAAYVAIGAPT